jgi:hypothetical protein
MLLGQLASIRAALFRLKVPENISVQFLHDRIFDFKPQRLDMVPAPTRGFWLHVLVAKVKATNGNIGDMIGWESDEEVVGPVAFAAKQSLLRTIPLIMPEEDPVHDLYRCVLEHGDFGIHNASINRIDPDHANVTSLYDWETGCIAPAMLSDPLVAVYPIDLTVCHAGHPTILRQPSDATSADREAYNRWAKYYAKVRATQYNVFPD